MSKLKTKTNKTDIILMLTIIILIIINLIIFSKNFFKNNKEQPKNPSTITVKSEEKPKQEQVAVPKTDEEIIKYLSELGERDRMEYYCGKYFKHIEKKEYESAYNLLYDEFKRKYFPTVEQYIEYIEKTYPKEWALEYDDIVRHGTTYVLRLFVYDVLQPEKEERVQRIVIKENNYNNFVMSFQVI